MYLFSQSYHSISADGLYTQPCCLSDILRVGFAQETQTLEKGNVPTEPPRPGQGWAVALTARAGCSRRAGARLRQLRAKGEEIISQAGVILGLKYHAESTQPEFQLKLHPSFLTD